MANKTEVKIVTFDNLKKYDTNIKTKMAADDAAVLSSAKSYADGLADNYEPAGTAQTLVDGLAGGAVKNNTDIITKLNGDESVEGSVANQIKNASAALKSEISASSYDDTEIKSRITANETAITSLLGTGEGSVDKKIADAVAGIISDAPEAYDTLKEIADWISSHTTDAAAMNSQISANKDDIAALKGLVTQLPEGSESTTIIEYITEQTGALKTALTAAIAAAKTEAVTEAGTNTDTKISAKVGDIGESTVKGYVDSAKTAADSKADQALADAKAYADEKTGQTLTDAKDYTDTLADRVAALENTTYTEITDEEIDSLFAPAAPAV